MPENRRCYTASVRATSTRLFQECRNGGTETRAAIAVEQDIFRTPTHSQTFCQTPEMFADSQRQRWVERRIPCANTTSCIYGREVDTHFRVNDLVLDVPSRQVSLAGQAIEASGVEFDILVALARRAGRVVARDVLLAEAGRGDVTVNDRTVDVHISHLRQKLGDDPPKRIKTVRGVGYVLAKDSIS